MQHKVIVEFSIPLPLSQGTPNPKADMEIQPNSPKVAKKLWNLVRAVFYMLRKGICKSKIMGEFHLLFKRGKLAGKAMAQNLIFHNHYSSFTCRSSDANLSFISPREYEFSCSNSPAFPFQAFKRNKYQHHYPTNKSHHYDDVTTLSAVQKMFEMLNSEIAEASPAVSLPGFGKSPIGKQLRITDSPFPLKDEGDSQVDKAAEEFIRRFYKDLKLQKTLALESPYHDTWCR